jgi:uncharacterized protein DUF222
MNNRRWIDVLGECALGNNRPSYVEAARERHSGLPESPPELTARFSAEPAAELAELDATGAYAAPADLYDADSLDPPTYLSEEDIFDDLLPPMSKVDALEWELWAGVDQDEAERAMLRRKAPGWVFLPPGAELAALEPVRPQYESPIALIELMRAASRLSSWAESIKTAAMASFFRQRKAQSAELPRPSQTDASGRPIDPERSWVAEIAAALHLSTNTAARNVDTALHLTGPLTETLTALRSGALTWSKALSISEATRALPDKTAQAVESHVLRRAASQTHANLRKSLRTQVAKHAAADEADRHRNAVKDRTCKIVPLADGMAGLWVVHTADKIQQMWVVIQAMADMAKRPTSPTTADPAGLAAASLGPLTAADLGSSPLTTVDPSSSRFTAAVPSAAKAADLAPGTPAHPTGSANPTPAQAGASSMPADSGESMPAAEPGDLMPEPAFLTPEAGQPETRTGLGGDPRPRDDRSAEQRRADVVADVFEVMLHNGLDWLGRRLPDQHRRRPHIEVLIPANTLLGLDDDPCELTGYGPIPAELARRIAADGTWRRLLTDPKNGIVLEASTRRHDPGSLVSETLLARHPVCAWPGCNRTARECDRDHGTPFAVSGRTSLAGLAPYCEYHHVIKDTPEWGWRTSNHRDGSITLTSPTGHRYTTVPPARGPSPRDPATQPPTSPARPEDRVGPKPIHEQSPATSGSPPF